MKLSVYLPNALDKDKGKTTVSQLERGKRNITINFAIAYAKIFGVTLDYVLCRSNDWRHENADTKTLTGLSDGAIAKLRKYESMEKAMLNKFLEHEHAVEVFNDIAKYRYFYRQRHEYRAREEAEDEELSRLLVTLGIRGEQKNEDRRDETDGWGQFDTIDYYKQTCVYKITRIIEDTVEDGGAPDA